MASERPDKKEKKEKKRSEADGVSKSKKDKKDKKEKKEKLAAAVDSQLQADAATTLADAAAPVVVDTAGVKKVVPAVQGALVPFAVPLADDKAMKKVMKSIRKGTYWNISRWRRIDPIVLCRKAPCHFSVEAS